MQTPTYILAFILVFFLVLTLGFEHAIHAAKHGLRKIGRAGLADALEKIVLELTILGFVSLILLVFKDYVPNVCVNFSPVQEKWTMLDSVQGCPCCLSETNGITFCAQIYHNCSFDSGTKVVDPYCGCDLGWENSTYDPVIAAGTNCTSFRANEEIFVSNTFGGALYPSSINNTNTNISTVALAPAPEIGVGGGDESRRRLFQQLQQQNEDFIHDHHSHSYYSRSLLQSEEENDIESAANSFLDGTGNFSTIENNTHVIPELGIFECNGPFYSGACPKGQHPAISDDAFEQMHLMLFLIAVVHVIFSVMVVLLAMWRVRQWRYWQNEDIKELKNGRHVERLETRAFVETESKKFEDDMLKKKLQEKTATMAGGSGSDTNEGRIEEGRENGFGIENRADSTGKHGAVDAEISPIRDEEKGNLVSSTTATATKTATSNVGEMLTAATTAAATANDYSTASASRIPTKSTSTFSNLRSKAISIARYIHSRFKTREHQLEHAHQYILEALICFFKAFYTTFIKKSEFSIIRRAYITSRNLPKDYDFVQEVTLHLDYDLVRIIGASLSMWTILILEKLLYGVVDWIGFFFLGLSAVVLLGMNIGLVASIRYAVRGGKPHRIKSAKRWYHGAHWLAIPIGGIIFYNSLTYSDALFYLWQFGPNSCYFDPPPGLNWSMQGPLPAWWVRLIAPGVMMFWIANLTVPTWAMVMHMRPREKDGHGGDGGGGALHGAVSGGEGHERSEDSGVRRGGNEVENGGAVEKYISQAELLSEINRLQALLSNLQN